MNRVIETMRTVIKQLPFDIRAEVVAADMASRGVMLEDMVIIAKSLFKRRFEKDILNISMQETKSGREYCAVEVSREGIYDALPQSLTHSQRRSKRPGMKSKEEMVDEIKVRRREEKFARQFFLPFENEFYYQRIVLEQEEQNILRAYQSQSKYTELLDQFWKLPSAFSLEQKAKLIYIFPILNKMVGDLKLTQQCYELILDVPVKLRVEFGGRFKAEHKLILNHQSTLLGVTTICGDSYAHDEPIVILDIGPIPSAKAQLYVKGYKKSEEVVALNDFFLPLDVEFKVNFIITTEQVIRLSEKNNIHLGYNFQLQNNHVTIQN